jgi:hypothetical protein
MKFSKFYNLFNDISYYVNANKELFEKFAISLDYETVYIIPFTEELNKNILKSTNKIDTIKHYLFKMFEIQLQYKNNDNRLLFNTPFYTKELSQYENYIEVTHYLYDQIFTEIQICCYKYEIDFFDICNVLNIDCTLFDCSIALAQEQKTNQKTVTENTTLKHENITSDNVFVNFNQFLNEVRTGNLSNIDIENYIYKLSKNHNSEKLKTILKDIEFYLFVEKDLIEEKITQKDWDKIHLHYQNKGETIPFERNEDIIKKTIDIKNNNLSTDSDYYFYNYYDKEKLFYTFEFFSIYQLEKYINSLILPTPNNTNHNHIFSNNGFILFEHILKTYVRPKDIRGRESDLIFFYWKMYFEKTQYIHVKPTVFFIWFDKNYDNIFGQLKTLQQVETPQRNKDFSNALDWFKTQNR